MTFDEIVTKLSSFGIEEPQGETFIILEELFDITRSRIISDKNFDYPCEKINEVLNLRKEHIPLQYIFGKWQFMGLDFYVSSDCLIPRADTEILVYRAIEEAENAHRVADFCTGSGCIGISMVKFCPNIEKMTLCDISDKALAIAEKNAKLNGVSKRCEFIKSDILNDVPYEKYDIILSNPPYIPTNDIDALSDEVKKEPIIALDGGEDGMKFIKRLVDVYINYLNENGKMIIEFGFDQSQAVDNLLKDNTKISSYEFIKDYGGNTRCVVICK